MTDEIEPTNAEARAAGTRPSFKIPETWRLLMKTIARKPSGGQPPSGSAFEWAKLLIPLITEIIRHIR